MMHSKLCQKNVEKNCDFQYSDEALLTVKGPRKELSKISKVVAYHNTDKKFDKTTTFVGDIRFYDEENNLLDASKFSYEHKTINISVPVSKTKSIDFKIRAA